jgi:hypothetical protein
VEFERGRTARAFYFRILEFLQQNRDKAYTAQEIDAAMGPANPQHGLAGFVTELSGLELTFAVLDNLFADGKVTAKIVEDTTGRTDSPKKNAYFMAV